LRCLNQGNTRARAVSVNPVPEAPVGALRFDPGVRELLV